MSRTLSSPKFSYCIQHGGERTHNYLVDSQLKMGCSPRIPKSSFKGTHQKDLFTVWFLKCLQVFTQMRIDPHNDMNQIQWTKDIATWPSISSCAQHELMPFIQRVPRIQCHNIVMFCWTMLHVVGGQKYWNFNNVKYFSKSKMCKSNDLPMLI